MKEEKIFTGHTEDEVWRQLSSDLNKGEAILEYKAIIEQGGKRIILDIDIDLGGGFESGYAFTTFSAPINVDNDFKFALHEEGLLDEAGKLFGMQDVVVGYPGFDDKVVIKTNDEEKAKAVFDNKEIREVLKTLPGFTLQIEPAEATEDAGNKPYLVLRIEDAFTDTKELRRVYHAFVNLLHKIEE